jgi:hypothetical protein
MVFIFLRHYNPDVDPKPRPNRRLYLQVLKRMTPSQRFNKAVELSELGKELFRQGLRKRFPDATDAEFHKLFLERLAKCHNRNY